MNSAQRAQTAANIPLAKGKKKGAAPSPPPQPTKLCHSWGCCDGHCKPQCGVHLQPRHGSSEEAKTWCNKSSTKRTQVDTQVHRHTHAHAANRVQVSMGIWRASHPPFTAQTPTQPPELPYVRRRRDEWMREDLRGTGSSSSSSSSALSSALSSSLSSSSPLSPLPTSSVSVSMPSSMAFCRVCAATAAARRWRDG